MAYLGNAPGQSTQRVTTTFTATEGQTTFTPVSGYTPGYVDVYLNGVKLIDTSDYVATNGVSIDLITGADLDSVLEVVAYIPRGLSDGYTKAEADARYEPIDSAYTKAEADGKYLLNTTDTFTGDLDVAGTVTTDGLTVNGDVGIATSTLRVPLNIKASSGGANIDLIGRDSDGYSTLAFRNSDNDTSLAALFADSDSASFQLYVAGSEALHITSDRKIGIGTDTPTYKFEISDGTRTAIINPNSILDGIFIGTKESKPLIFGTDDNERMRINTEGNVGIGTTSPASFGGGYKVLEVQGVSTSDGGAFRTSTSNDSVVGDFYSYAGGVMIESRTSAPLRFWTNNSEAMRITSNSNIGIGTSGETAPNNRLTFGVVNDDPIHIRANVTSQGQPAEGTGVSWAWRSSGTDNDTWAAVRAIFPGSGNTHLSFQTTAGGGETNLRENMRIHDSGIVTKPNQPAFNAYDPPQTSQGLDVVFGSTRTNIGGHYNTSNGRFTAPVSGVYFFTFSLLMGNSMSTYIRVLFSVNGNPSTTYGDSLAGGNTSYNDWAYDYTTLSTVIHLNAGDYISVRNDGPTPTYGSQYGSFSGYLVG